MINSMLGHKNILDNLGLAITNNTVGHAYIFEGPDGIGKRETALSFSRMLMCEAKDFPCGTCRACLLFSEQSNPDFQEIICEGKSIGVEDIRRITKDIVIRPLYSEYKVIIINDADKMTLQAQNALLKSLEEPPRYIVFILTAHSASSLAPTIRSRCQKIQFSKLADSEIENILSARYGDLDRGFIISYADGVIGTALELADNPQLLELRDRVLGAIASLISSSGENIIDVSKLFEDNTDKLQFMLKIVLLYLRDLLIYSKTENISILINSDKKDMIICNADVKQPALIRCIQSVWDTAEAIGYNANAQLAVEVLLIQLGKLRIG